MDPDYGPVVARPLITSGLSQPLFALNPPGQPRWLFIVQKGGAIRLFDREEGSLQTIPVFTVTSITTAGERGLLGMAFHPGFSENGYFYLNFTNSQGHTVVRRYTMTTTHPFTVDPGSAHDLITITQDFSNHNGGWIGFSPLDGYLYVALGDGGSSNDPNNRAQDLNNLLGSILRLDVNSDSFPDDPSRNYGLPADNPRVGLTGRPEIWAYGLRNPWRCSFDRLTGDFWIGDVGQNSREEINFQPASSPGGENYGWRLKEGTRVTGLGPGSDLSGLTDPVYEYDFSDGNKAITGGYVYRGSRMPQLRGHYFLADYMADFIRSFRYSGNGTVGAGEVVDWTARFGSISNPASFSEDAEGELFIISLFGRIYEITQAPWFLWRNRHFAEADIRDPAVSGETADPDQDGIPNLIEYALGLDPNSPDDRWPVSVAQEADANERFLVLTITRRNAPADVILAVEGRNSLHGAGEWSAQGLQVVHQSPSEIRVRDSVPLSAVDGRFLRLRATRVVD